MSKTILAQVDGFTPLIDGIVLDLGLMSAAVFGKAWRYCQMKDGACLAGQERIAEELGVTRATVNAHLDKLVEAGYLRIARHTGFPNEYIDTGKANLSISFTGVVNNFDKGCIKDLQGGVKEIDTKKEVKKEVNTVIEQANLKVDAILQMVDMPGLKKEQRLLTYETLVKVKTGVEPTRKKWQAFFDYIDRQNQPGQSLTIFLDWLVKQPGYDINFWGPERMRENWQRAFTAAPVEENPYAHYRNVTAERLANESR